MQLNLVTLVQILYICLKKFIEYVHIINLGSNYHFESISLDFGLVVTTSNIMFELIKYYRFEFLRTKLW